MMTKTLIGDAMTGKFIHVFDEQAKDRLLLLGFVLLTEGPGPVYIFHNDARLQFDKSDMEYVITDRMFV